MNEPKPPTWRDRVEMFRLYEEAELPMPEADAATRMAWLEEMYRLAARHSPDRRTEADLLEEALLHKRLTDDLARLRA